MTQGFKPKFLRHFADVCQCTEKMEEIRTELNKLVAPYERITRIELIANEFEKTPKRSIKRFLYSH